MDDNDWKAGVYRPLATASWLNYFLWCSLIGGVIGAAIGLLAGEPVLAVLATAIGVEGAWMCRMGAVLFGWLAARFEQSERIAAETLVESDV